MIETDKKSGTEWLRMDVKFWHLLAGAFIFAATTAFTTGSVVSKFRSDVDTNKEELKRLDDQGTVHERTKMTEIEKFMSRIDQTLKDRLPEK